MKNLWGVVLLLAACGGGEEPGAEVVRDTASVLFQITNRASPDAFSALVKQLKGSWEAEDRDPRWRRTVTVVASQSRLIEDCSPGEYRCSDVRRVISTLPDAWQRAAAESGASIVPDSVDFDPTRTYLAVVDAGPDSINVLDFTVEGGWRAVYEYECGNVGCSLSETDDWCHLDYYAGSPLEKVADVMEMMLSCVSEAASR